MATVGSWTGHCIQGRRRRNSPELTAHDLNTHNTSRRNIMAGVLYMLKKMQPTSHEDFSIESEPGHSNEKH
eukprot:3580008-Karenia_brevis.AAC.1